MIIYETTTNALNIGLEKDDGGLYHLYWVNPYNGDQMKTDGRTAQELLDWAVQPYNGTGLDSIHLMAKFVLEEVVPNAYRDGEFGE